MAALKRAGVPPDQRYDQGCDIAVHGVVPARVDRPEHDDCRKQPCRRSEASADTAKVPRIQHCDGHVHARHRGNPGPEDGSIGTQAGRKIGRIAEHFRTIGVGVQYGEEITGPGIREELAVEQWAGGRQGRRKDGSDERHGQREGPEIAQPAATILRERHEDQDAEPLHEPEPRVNHIDDRRCPGWGPTMCDPPWCVAMEPSADRQEIRVRVERYECRYLELEGGECRNREQEDRHDAHRRDERADKDAAHSLQRFPGPVQYAQCRHDHQDDSGHRLCHHRGILRQERQIIAGINGDGAGDIGRARRRQPCKAAGRDWRRCCRC